MTRLVKFLRAFVRVMLVIGSCLAAGVSILWAFGELGPWFGAVMVVFIAAIAISFATMED